MRFRLTPAAGPRVRESHVIEASLDLGRLKGWYPLRQHVGRFRSASGSWITLGEPGMPDYAFMHPHMPGFFAEFKRPHGEAEIHQARKHEELRRCWGFDIAVVSSAEEFIEYLKSRKR